MFKRLAYENWQQLAPVVAFLLTFAVFLFQVVRALRIKPDQSERLARLPLEDQSAESELSHTTTPAPRKS